VKAYERVWSRAALVFDNRLGHNKMVRSSILLTVCVLVFFPPSLLADGVHYRAGSVSNSFFHFTDADRNSDGGDSAFFEYGTFGPAEHHFIWLDDLENDHGEAWGWRLNHHHHHHLDGDGTGSFVDQGDKDVDGDSGNEGGTSGGDPPTPGVPEPSVLVLLSAALAVFLLKSLRSATD
jgi:hypothetical protein